MIDGIDTRYFQYGIKIKSNIKPNFVIEMQVMNKLEKLSKDLSSLMLLTYHVDVMSNVRQK